MKDSAGVVLEKPASSVIRQHEARQQATMRPYWVSIFLGAFLMFAVQLLLGKYLLPWFGGTPAMWTTCMFFFQILLLAGYAYAHALASWCSARTQAIVHSFLLLASLLLLAISAAVWHSPLTPGANWRPQASEHPIWNLVVVLTVSAGLPFFTLASTGPLLQSWFTRTQPMRSPYRLYALSNFGSLLGLLSYPFVVEPWLTLRMQGRVWAFMFVVYSLACAFCAVQLWRLKRNCSERETMTEHLLSSAAKRPGTAEHFIWLGLAAGASIMFLATTSQICQDVAVVPFLWVLPLSIYLLSFIICFDQSKWYSRRVFYPIFAVAIFLACFVLNGWALNKIMIQVVAYSFTLFACCMVCHGELARLKPGSAYLTSFYMMVACGGAMGGTLVALIFPKIFQAFWEYHLGLWLSVLLVLLVLARHSTSPLYSNRLALPSLAVGTALLPGLTSLATQGTRSLVNLLPALAVLVGVYALNRWGRTDSNEGRVRAVPFYCGAVLLVLGAVLFFAARGQVQDATLVSRNFYGVLTVRELNGSYPEWRAYSLQHGRIAHGFQFQAESKRKVPTGYYGTASGAGRALATLQARATESGGHLRVGVVGLGVGTLAAYMRSGDYIRFYEINPQVTRVALDQKFFTYLENCRANVDVTHGDARLSMEAELGRGEPQSFDFLAIDAFSGDAIPVHLLTREAFEIYLQEIQSRGILAVHITNAHLDLRPVLLKVAEHFRLHYALLHTSGDGEVNSYSDWVLLSYDENLLNSILSPGERNTSKETLPAFSLWTDEYSNLFTLLRR